MAVSHPTPDAARSDLSVLASRVWSYRWLIVAAALLGAVGAFAVASMRTPMYESAATVLVRQASPTATTAVTSTARALIQNQQVASRVVQALKLDAPPRNLTGTDLMKVLRVEDVPGTFLMRAIVRLPEPQLAADVANRLVAEAIALNDSLNAGAGQGVNGVLQSELAAARKRLIEAETRLATFREKRRAGQVGAGLHEAETEGARLHAEYDLASRLYEEVAVQYGKLRLQLAERTMDVVVVEPAYVAPAPLSTRRAAAAFFGGVTGLTFAAVVVGLLAVASRPAANGR